VIALKSMEHVLASLVAAVIALFLLRDARKPALRTPDDSLVLAYGPATRFAGSLIGLLPLGFTLESMARKSAFMLDYETLYFNHQFLVLN
jgi:hypothetical protein